MEMKIKHRKDAREKGLDQLCQYLDRLGQHHGYLVLFEPQSVADISWEQRIQWETVSHKDKNITIVEM
jgi:hypothetical protein